MYGIVNFETFLIASAILAITPGADTMYALGKSLSGGKKAGILSALGSGTGLLVHCLFAALGLSLILANSAVAFNIVKYLGAFYLVFLGIRSLIASNDKPLDLNEKTEKTDYVKIYLSGILTNVLNPKVALFFLAFLPQFVVSDYTQSWVPFLILGVIFFILGTLWCLTVALFASKLSEKLRKNAGMKVWLDRIAGSVFIILGIKIAMSKK